MIALGPLANCHLLFAKSPGPSRYIVSTHFYQLISHAAHNSLALIKINSVRHSRLIFSRTLLFLLAFLARLMETKTHRTGQSWSEKTSNKYVRQYVKGIRLADRL